MHNNATDDVHQRDRTPSKLPVTVILAVRNEAANLPRCLSALARAERVLVIDSDSNDTTPLIAKTYGAELHVFQPIGAYPKKRQWAIENLDIQTPWIMFIDADEVVTPDLWEEIGDTIKNGASHDAYLVCKGFHFLGRRFRFGGFSHSAVCLLKTGHGRFEKLLTEDGSGLDMEVHERIIVRGSIGSLKTPLIHEDLKGIDAYIDRHRKYSIWEAQIRSNALLGNGYGLDAISPRWLGNSQERRRALKMIMMRIPFEPMLWFIYHFFFRLGFLEGHPGLLASQIRRNYIKQVQVQVVQIIAKAKQPTVDCVNP